MIAEHNGVVVRPIRDEDVDDAVVCRSNNASFHFGGAPDPVASRQWILRHRYDDQDAILEFSLKSDDIFLGTIGYTISGTKAEVGRIDVFLPSIRVLLQRQIDSRVLSQATGNAGYALITYLFQHYSIDLVEAKVMKNNGFSSSLCQRLGFVSASTAENEEYARYVITRSRFERANIISCLFFQHNMIEDTHNAIADFIHTMQLNGVAFHFAAKRVLHNDLYAKIGSPDVTLLADIPMYKPFFKDFDFLHIVYDGQPSLLLCAAGYVFGIPYILTFHGGDDTNSKIFHDSVREATGFFSRKSFATTVVCEQDKRALQSIGADSGNILILPPAIRVFPHAGEYCTDNHRIAVVGRMIPKKGIDVAIRALSLMPTEYSMDIVGDGPLNSTLHELAVQLGVDSRIAWHGTLPVDSMIDVIRGAGILWHPAVVGPDGNAEGIPQILLYAMSEGMMVVTTRSGHIEDLVKDGYNGVLVDPNDPQGLVDATLRNLDHRQILRNGARTTSERYSLSDQKLKWLDLYNKARRARNVRHA